MTKNLAVYLLQNKVGMLAQTSGGQMQFTYDADWLQHEDAIPVSYSLPLQERTFRQNECNGFFAGALPEADLRKKITKQLGISEKNHFALLRAIGGECAGAVTFVSENEERQLDAAHLPTAPLDETSLLNILQILDRKPLLAGEQGVRISLAGAQNKLAIRIKAGTYTLPGPNSPSTHIIKPAIANYPGIVANEAFCMNLAQSMGLDCAKAEACQIKDKAFLLVRRYDREIQHDGQVVRLHQEDYCQALNVSPEQKYQKEGGPGFKACFQLLNDVSSAPILDLRKLLNAVIFNYLIGNADAHGKNYSLLYKEGRIQLAPLYDVLCTKIYDALSEDMAMKIGKHHHLDQVTPKDWDTFAKDINLSTKLVRERVMQMSRDLQAKLKAKSPSNETEQRLIKLILKRCQTTLERFAHEY